MTSEIQFYLKLLWRRLPFMLIIIAVCVSISGTVAMRLPATYSSSATLLVEFSEIPDRMVGADLGLGVNQQLELVQRSLMTRANLLDVARETEVFPGISRMTPDQIVTKMRDATGIRSGGGGRRGGLNGMTVSFEGESPQKVADVVNRYVTILLATGSDIRNSRARGTLDFFAQEVQRLTEQLEEQSQKIVAYKSQNADALPEYLTYRLNRQSLLQERLSRAEQDMEALRTQRKNIVQIYETTGRLEPSDPAAQTPEQRQLEQLERELTSALAIYSDTNPKIRLLRSRIDGLKNQIEAAVLASPQTDGTTDEFSRAETALQLNLSEIDARNEALQEEVDAIEQELETLQDSIERTPSARITLQAMERDLENLRQLYSTAVERLNQARMGERVQTSAKGERFTLLEPASVPNAPASSQPDDDCRRRLCGGARSGRWLLHVARTAGTGDPPPERDRTEAGGHTSGNSAPDRNGEPSPPAPGQEIDAGPVRPDRGAWNTLGFRHVLHRSGQADRNDCRPTLINSPSTDTTEHHLLCPRTGNMEKLRTALEKARGERLEKTAPRAYRGAGPAAPDPKSDIVSNRWAALPQLELDNKKLIENKIFSYVSSSEGMHFDMLRTKIQLLMRQNGWSRIAITSPDKGSGKTTLACNLALGLSRQKSLRTILLDFDMRRPGIAKALKQSVETQLEEVLSGEIPPETHLKCLNNNLAILMSDNVVDDPMRYIMSEKMADLLDRLQQDYKADLLIFDLPPMLAVDETRALLKHVDCAIIVARAERTRMSALDRCEQEVAQYCNVLGIVLNSCRYKADPEDLEGMQYY